MKKGIIAGVGAVLLIGGGVFGINSVFADSNQNQTGSTQTVQAPVANTTQQTGKRVQILNQYKDQIHQINQLREARLDLRKQVIEKRDQLMDLLLAAKNSGNKAQLQQAKAIRPEIKSIKLEIKNLLNDRKSERMILKQTLKTNGDGSSEYHQLITTNQQINTKLQSMIDELNQMISIFPSQTNA